MRLLYGWMLAIVAVSWMSAAPGLAGVIFTGDTKDGGTSGSIFYAGYNDNATGGLTIDAGSTFRHSLATSAGEPDLQVPPLLVVLDRIGRTPPSYISATTELVRSR